MDIFKNSPNASCYLMLIRLLLKDKPVGKYVEYKNNGFGLLISITNFLFLIFCPPNKINITSFLAHPSTFVLNLSPNYT